MTPEVKDGAGIVIWKNAYLDVVPEKTRVAQTLTDYRRAYLYNRYDAPLRAFSAQVPQVWQWDDHEVANNWYRGRPLNPKLYAVSMQTLIEHGTRAFLEYAPLRLHPTESGRIYRTLEYGPLLEVFVLDLRSYRNANGCNLEPEASTSTEYMGPTQLTWLKLALQRSKSTWKVIASDMPLGLRVSDGRDPSGCGARWDNSSNQSGPVRGREFEIAELLGFIHQAKITNVVWLTADVHYAAAHFYDPAAAQFSEFTPFWEFVAGPLNAGTFGPEALDDTFGPRVVFHSAPPPGQGGLSPRAGLQFFGQVDIDSHSRALTVRLKNLEGREIFAQAIPAAAT
jgi:alkaline phosphatase D